METEWDLDDPVGEIIHMEGVAARYGLPSAAVAHAVLRDPHVEDILEQLGAHPLVRAVRNKPGQAASPREAPNQPSLLMDPQWRRGFALLKKYGLDFELQTAWWHLNEALDLAKQHPDTPITINHTGLPSDRSPEGITGWAAALSEVAQAPNVRIKIPESVFRAFHGAQPTTGRSWNGRPKYSAMSGSCSPATSPWTG